MLNSRIKFCLLFLIFTGAFLINTQYTDADIFAERNIKNNSFKVASLNFFAKSPVNNIDSTNMFKTIGIIPDGYDFGAIKLKRDGNVTFNYHVSLKKTNGDDNFCNNLDVQVLRRNMSSVYQGKLMSLSLDANINNDNVTDWIFLVSLGNWGNELKNKICEFNLEFKTYRNNPSESNGIYAKRILANLVSSGSW